MTWRDELRPASFRGVPFLVEQATTTHELFADEQIFPGRERAGDAVHVEPLGAGPERFQIEAFVAGPFYHEARDALVEALKAPGAGRLVHPYRGERVVSVLGQIRVSEQRRAGGYARISFEAVETETPRLRRTVDTAAVVARDVDAFLEALADDFSVAYDQEAPEELRQTSIDAFDAASASLEAVYSDALAGLGAVRDFRGDVSEYSADLARFASLPTSAVRALISTLGVVASIPQQVVIPAGRGPVDALIAAMAPLVGYGDDLPPIPGATPSRDLERANRAATVQAVRGAAVGQLIAAVTRMPFDSRSHATEARDRLLEELEALVDEGSAGGDTVSGAELYEAIAALRASAATRLSEIARSLPEIEAYAVPADLPALVVAHDLYGDAREAESLVARNDPSRPYYLPRGTELEVIRG
ncbi:MAG: DNA circularization N-terminal domain-containing protein [Sandaracinaceae bacterium]